MRRRVALSLAARLSRAVVGVSQNTADTLATSLRLARSRVQVIPNGIEPKAGDRRAGREAFGVGDDERVVLAVGNLYPVKGHDTLVRAAAALSTYSDLPPWRVFIAGRGDQEQPLRALIAAHNLEGRVSLLGLRDDIADLLAGADIFAMPSRLEGLPLAVLEAMLAKRPVVCSQVGGMPDLLEHGRLGALVPPEDPDALAGALRGIMRQYDEASRVAEAAFDTIFETYSADAMTTAYLRAFGQ
jgi:glycosyltransferase involved in cell wall biosynthesis